MKRLFIIRHAKSSWDDLALDDFDRPLNKRGLKNAPFMGQLLKKKNVQPDMILHSPAKRTTQTAQLIAKEVKFEKALTPNQYIYEAYVSTLQEIVSYTYDTIQTLFLVGHNPAVTALAYTLCGFKEEMPTCAIVEIAFECDSWMDIGKHNAQLISYEYPKKYT